LREASSIVPRIAGEMAFRSRTRNSTSNRNIETVRTNSAVAVARSERCPFTRSWTRTELAPA
jgi:hypothetical protein